MDLGKKKFGFQLEDFGMKPILGKRLNWKSDLEIGQTLWLSLVLLTFSTWKGKLLPGKCPQFLPIIPEACDWPKTQTPGLVGVFSSSIQHLRDGQTNDTFLFPSHCVQGPGWSHMLMAKNTTIPVGPTEADTASVDLKWSMIRDLLLPCTIWIWQHHAHRW